MRKRARETDTRVKDSTEKSLNGAPEVGLFVARPLWPPHTLVLPSHPTSPLLHVTHEEGEVGGIDLAQSKCCQEDWMILLRQGVL